MSITHEEFRRVLQMAFPETGSFISDDPAVFNFEDGRVRVVLSPQTTRSIGNLRLPVTKVTLEFGDMAEEEKKRFVERFNRSFQRGGG
ncbi:MAG: hypothetical protein WD750_03420 [Gammaproteobacteria bacterium]